MYLWVQRGSYGLVNQFGEKYEIGKIYTDPNIDMDMGYHFCKNIEDVFLFPEYRENIEIYKVCGSDKITTYWNDYYGLYDVYAAEKLEIIRNVPREEIIQYFLNYSDFYYSRRVINFISVLNYTKMKFNRLRKFLKKDFKRIII